MTIEELEDQGIIRTSWQLTYRYSRALPRNYVSAVYLRREDKSWLLKVKLDFEMATPPYTITTAIPITSRAANLIYKTQPTRLAEVKTFLVLAGDLQAWGRLTEKVELCMVPTQDFRDLLAGQIVPCFDKE